MKVEVNFNATVEVASNLSFKVNYDYTDNVKLSGGILLEQNSCIEDRQQHQHF